MITLDTLNDGINTVIKNQKQQATNTQTDGKSTKNALIKQKGQTWADVAKSNAVFDFTTKTNTKANTNAFASAKTNAQSATKGWTEVQKSIKNKIDKIKRVIVTSNESFELDPIIVRNAINLAFQNAKLERIQIATIAKA